MERCAADIITPCFINQSGVCYIIICHIILLTIIYLFHSDSMIHYYN